MRAVILTALVLAAGCVEFNEPCSGLVDDPNQVVGHLGEQVYLDRANTRHANNAMGQLAADAFVDAFTGQSAPALLGLMNGGGIRAEGLCITRNVLKPGPITNGLVHEIFLFENQVLAVDLDERDLYETFEHAVERLTTAPQPIVSPAGQFLQVSKEVKLVVDCTQPIGSRIRSLSIGGVPVSRTGDGKRYRVAATEFLASAEGDRFEAIHQASQNPDRNPRRSLQAGGLDSDIIADYFSRVHPTAESALKVDASRITFVGCSAPLPPE